MGDFLNFLRAQARSRVSRLLGLLLFPPFMLLLTACQPDTNVASGQVIEPVNTLDVATPPPPVVITVVTSQNQRSFSLLSKDELSATAAAQYAEPLTVTSAVGPNTADPVETVPTATPTPLPTFTPPALPKTQPGEHYWLRRPVPEGGTVWTDKAYPYGNNRGGTLRTHHGVEFNVPRGTPILAAASGTVVVAGDDRIVTLGATPDFYGNIVVIQHDTGLDDQPVFSVYGHLSEIYVQVDQHVQAEEFIALSGASGVADGPHLHFEVRVGENSYQATRNPLLWLYPFPDKGVVAGQIWTKNGELAAGVPLQLRRIDAPSPYAATTTYADDSVNADEKWQENFAFDDVAAGYYELVIGTGTGKDKQSVELWVFPYQTNFIEYVLED